MLPPWTPGLDSLELLLSVAQTGSIARAAALHGITQPSASAKLARLERRTGVALFARRTTGTQLTATGETVAAWAADVIAAAQALTDGLQALRTTTEGRLTVVSSLTIAEYLLPTWLVALRATRPDIAVTATVANSHDVIEHLRAGDAELGFIEAPYVPTGFNSCPVATDEVVLVVSATHPLARSTDEGISPFSVLELPLLMREEGSGTRDTFLQALARSLGRNKPPTLPYATTLGSTATILASTRAGAGVGVVSRRAIAGDVATGLLRLVPANGLRAERPLTAVWLGSATTPAAGELIRIAMNR